MNSPWTDMAGSNFCDSDKSS